MRKRNSIYFYQTLMEKPILVRSSNKDTNKMIVKKQKRMLKRNSILPRTGDTRITNAFGTKGRMVYIGSFD